ncbi:MAG: peptidoglycan bridge formation glycyltransferase FemA/FemB family protein [Candidatus Blackburnbacteria bacterium]|nr:peptidoglycan bridge formation glycyltransferase FemA/FemB family protein [Candidatus Blackburnbacteria bacterium]
MITDLRQTKEYAKYMERLGWQIFRLNEDRVYVRKIPLLGNVAKLQRPQRIPTLEEIKVFCRKHSVGSLYLEPPSHKSQVTGNLTFAKNSFVPAKTIHIDLSSSEQTLLKKMKSKTRYNIKIAQRYVVIKKSTDIEVFIKMWKLSARERGMWLSQDKEIRALWEAFGDKAHLLLAYDTTLLHRSVGNPLGGVLLVESPNTMYYMYVGSTKSGKQLFAPTLLAWEAIRLARDKKKKFFDFEGVYDKRYSSTKTWKGFTKFKEGFGGKVLEYPPTLVYYSNPLLRILNI